MTESSSSDQSANTKAEPKQSSQRLESFSYDDVIVRRFLLATVIWGLVSALLGIATSLLLVMPKLSLVSIFTFGRLQPVYINLAIFGLGGNAIFAAVYYSTQRLCKARMFSDVLSKLHFWGWQTVLIAALFTSAVGDHSRQTVRRV